MSHTTKRLFPLKGVSCRLVTAAAVMLMVAVVAVKLELGQAKESKVMAADKEDDGSGGEDSTPAKHSPEPQSQDSLQSRRSCQLCPPVTHPPLKFCVPCSGVIPPRPPVVIHKPSTPQNIVSCDLCNPVTTQTTTTPPPPPPVVVRPPSPPPPVVIPPPSPLPPVVTPPPPPPTSGRSQCIPCMGLTTFTISPSQSSTSICIPCSPTDQTTPALPKPCILCALCRGCNTPVT